MSAAGGQLPLALRFPPDQRLESWVGDPAVALLLAAFARGEEGPGVFVHGPRGAGKTHLALAVCAAAEQAGRRAAYLPLPEDRVRLRQMLQIGEVELLAIDDLQQLAGEREAEIALFELHNRMRAAGGCVLYAADGAARTLPLVLPDLRSRLTQCAGIALPPPDDGLRRRILSSRAARRGLQVDEAAIDWLLRRTGRDLASLTALLERIDRAALAAQRKVTVPFLRQLLGDQAGS